MLSFSGLRPPRRKTALSRYLATVSGLRRPATVRGLPSAFAGVPLVVQTTTTRSGQPSVLLSFPWQPSPPPGHAVRVLPAGLVTPDLRPWLRGSRALSSSRLSPAPRDTVPILAEGPLGWVGPWGCPLRKWTADRPPLRLCGHPCPAPRSRSCVGPSRHHRELFKMQAMSLPC